MRVTAPGEGPEVRPNLEAVAGGCNALGHPLRLRLLYAMRSRGESSPVELAAEVIRGEGSVSTVAYHVRRLLDAGLIELAGTRPVRGALEHRYRLTGQGSDWLAALDSLRRR